MAKVITSTTPFVGTTKLNGDCIDPQILDGQAFGRTLVQASAQSRADYIAMVRDRGYTRTWCAVISIFALLYLATSVVIFVFAGNGQTFDLITGGVDDFGNPTPSFGVRYPLSWTLAAFALAVAIVYGGVAIVRGQDYLAAQMYGRAEACTGPVTYVLHAGFLGAAVLLFTGHLYTTSFFVLSFVFAGIVAAAYTFIGNSTGWSNGWSFTTVIAFIVATTINIIQWVLLIYAMATESLAAWELVATSFYIIGGFAYWANVLAWIFAWGTYKGVKSPRDRVDIYSIVAISILLLQAMFILIPYILYGLNLV